MKMDIEDGLNIITTAFKNDTKDKLYQMYVSHSPHMDKDNYISFDQYYNNVTNKKTFRKQNKEEVNKKVDDILKRYAI